MPLSAGGRSLVEEVAKPVLDSEPFAVANGSEAQRDQQLVNNGTICGSQLDPATQAAI